MNLPKEFTMQNTAWECPRCGRMNAPFNPVCFCSPEEIKTSAGKSEHVMDAERYLNSDALEKILKKNDQMTKIAIGMMPNLYNPRCSICNGFHTHAQDCINLSM